MRPLQKLMGRRQFLVTAGLTSALGLGYRKLTGIFNPNVETGVALASENLEMPVEKGFTSDRYSHLMSPFKIRNVLVRNRMLHTVSTPHFLQGPETFPAELVRDYYAQVAKNAAIVTVRDSSRGQPRKDRFGDSAHMPIWDGSDPAVENYVDQVIESIHCMGSLVSYGSLGAGPGPGMTGQENQVSIEDIITQAKKLEDRGVDVVSIGGRNLQDEDAARIAMDQMEAVRNSTNLLIMMNMMIVLPGISREMVMPGMPGGGMPGMPPGGMPKMPQGAMPKMPGGSTPGDVRGFSLEGAVTAAKKFDGLADILFFKVAGGLTNHPNSFNQKKGKPEAIGVSQALKESGIKMTVVPNGGFRDPDLNEIFIASGKADMIGMARIFISEPEYSKKIYEGRSEDIVPCIMCNKCHGESFTGPWFTICTVNPEFGITSAVKTIKAPDSKKKVAVIGGGPAGMKAALVAAERGHSVILYESSESLGGLTRHSDYSPLKWALKEFKDYLVHQVEKAGVEVILRTRTTPEMIKNKKYDVVLVAIGAEPVIPRIPGASGSNLWNVVDVYPDEKKLGKNVVVIGGGDFGTETGMFLANAGHSVTAITSDSELMKPGGPHIKEIQIDLYKRMDNFKYITNSRATSISKEKVMYVDADGKEQSIKADSVVVYSGLKPKKDEAMKYTGSASRVHILGDCSGMAGNVQKTIRSAFFTASQI